MPAADGTFGPPEDVACIGGASASDKAAWTSGAIFSIDGGYTTR
ncbi:hypothetical protein ABMA59_16645 [Mesorhizobium sp. CN2-181]